MNATKRHAHRTAAARYLAAHEALERNALEEIAAGVEHETGTFLALNHAAWESCEGVPGWLQAILDWRLARKMTRGAK